MKKFLLQTMGKVSEKKWVSIEQGFKGLKQTHSKGTQIKNGSVMMYISKN